MGLDSECGDTASAFLWFTSQCEGPQGRGDGIPVCRRRGDGLGQAWAGHHSEGDSGGHEAPEGDEGCGSVAGAQVVF